MLILCSLSLTGDAQKNVFDDDSQVSPQIGWVKLLEVLQISFGVVTAHILLVTITLSMLKTSTQVTSITLTGKLTVASLY